MNAELLLMRAVLAGRDLTALMERGIEEGHFIQSPARHLFREAAAHHARYGVVPAASTLGEDERFAELDLTEPPEPIEVYLDKVLHAHVSRLLESGLAQAAAALDDGDTAGAKALVAQSLAEAESAAVTGHTLELTATDRARLERYKAFEASDDGLRGIPTGFPAVDRATLGLQPGQLVTLIGLPKGGKTTLLINMAKYAHQYSYDHGLEFVPMIFGFEMSNDEIAERIDAWRAGVDTRRLRAGELNVMDWRKLERSINELSTMSPFYLVTGMGSLTTVSQIAERVETLNPDVLYIDGAYMIKDEISGEVNTAQGLTNITRSLKRLAQSRGIPVCISTQALAWKVDRKAGITSASIGYSSSFAQDSDVVIAVESTEIDEIKKLKIVASRNSPNLEVFVEWDWSTGTYQEKDDNPFTDLEDGSGW